MNKSSSLYVSRLAAKNGTTIEAARAQLNELTAEQCKGRYGSDIDAAREHLCSLMGKALDAGDGDLYQDLQDQLGRTYR